MSAEFINIFLNIYFMGKQSIKEEQRTFGHIKISVSFE